MRIRSDRFSNVAPMLFLVSCGVFMLYYYLFIIFHIGTVIMSPIIAGLFLLAVYISARRSERIIWLILNSYLLFLAFWIAQSLYRADDMSFTAKSEGRVLYQDGHITLAGLVDELQFATPLFLFLFGAFLIVMLIYRRIEL